MPSAAEMLARMQADGDDLAAAADAFASAVAKTERIVGNGRAVMEALTELTAAQDRWSKTLFRATETRETLAGVINGAFWDWTNTDGRLDPEGNFARYLLEVLAGYRFAVVKHG